MRIETQWSRLLGRGQDSLGVLTDQPAFLDYQAGRLGYEGYLEALARGLGVTPEMAARAHEAILVEPFPGTLEFVLELEEAGWSTGCLSNTNGPHWDVMLTSGRFPAVAHLGCRVASHEIGFDKPRVEAYRAYERLSGLCGSELVFFDDSAANVMAARELGWRAFLVPPVEDTVKVMRRVTSMLRFEEI